VPTVAFVELVTKERQTKKETEKGRSQLVIHYRGKTDLHFSLPYVEIPDNGYYDWELGNFGHFRCNEGSYWYSKAAMLLSKSEPVYEVLPNERVMDSGCVYSKKGKKTPLNTDNNWKDSSYSNFATVDIAMFK